MSHEEKLSGARRAEKLMENFRDAIKDCNLLEVPFSGSKFTWHRGT